MEEDKDKNINFLPNDLKSKNKKTSKKKEENYEYEPEMVSPDSAKLRKAKNVDMSGSNISFVEKISNWLEAKFSFLNKNKKEEKPRIQELQELIGKSQHVGEIMINDEEVLPDEERDYVVKREKEDVPIEEGAVKDDLFKAKEQEQVAFISKEDNEEQGRKALREKYVAERNKNIAKAQEIALHPNKDTKIPKEEDGVYSMPQSLSEVSLPEKIEANDDLQSDNKEDVSLDLYGDESGPSWWDKIKAFFTGVFAPKAKKIKDEKKEEVGGESILSYELRKAASIAPAEEDDEHVVSTPAGNFAEGIKIMKKAPEEPEERVATLKESDTEANKNNILGGKEELLKAQEELFSDVPEQSPELEDIFSKLDKNLQDKNIVSKKIELETNKLSLWAKIKGFFAGLFSPKAKELKSEKLDADNVEANIELAASEPVHENKPVEQEIKEEAIAEAEPVILQSPIEAEKPEEIVKDFSKEEIIENIPEEKKTDDLKPSFLEDQGVEESLPRSLTEPDFEESQNTKEGRSGGENKITEEVEVKLSFFDKIKFFFTKLFSSKAKELKFDQVDMQMANVADASTGANLGNAPIAEESENKEGVNLVIDKAKEFDKKKSKEAIAEDELSSKFHQPSISTVTRLIDEEGGVDLIPIAIRTKSWMQIGQLLAAAVIGSIVIVLSFYATLYFQQVNLEKEKDKQQNQISDLEQKILDYKGTNEEIKTLGQDIATVYDLFNKHIYWTNLFDLIEKYTLDDVYFSGFTSGTGGGLTFSATGKSYDTAARQLKLLQSDEAKEFVKSATINSVSGGEGEVTFSISLVLNDDLFYYDYTKILLVEDGEWEFDTAYEDKFRDEDFVFLSASTYQGAQEIIKSENPDIILLDLDLSTASGLEALSEIRKVPRIKEIPVLLLVSSKQDKNIKDAMELGALDYILKSDMTPEYTVDIIKSYLNMNDKN